ncbi:hypothetical protein [[Clostridium] scindens]|uniref:hypothetical protein n=1 Tax=Clostridium scindens (strain JCM 10418 / VPI 12708) TaxID=29347 RepID=UPI0039A3B03D
MGLKGITIETPPQAEAHINAADDRAIWEAVIGMDGVVNVGQKLKATLISNNLLRIYDGALVVGGAVGRIPFGEYEDITINNGTQNQLRNDLVVAQIEANGAIENMKLHYIQGVPGEVAKDPDYTAGNVYEGETLRQYPLYRVKLNGLNVEAVEPLFEVLPNLGKVKDEVGELNRKFVFKRRNSSEAGICTPHYIMIMGTRVLQGANADYRQLFLASDLLSKLKFYDPSISNFDEKKCVIATNNGDGNAAAIHFYAPEWWGSNNAYYQYFYPGTSSPIRVNYCIHYLKS